MKGRLTILATLLLAVSCSTTRVLPEGEYRLAGNKISVTNDKTFRTGQLDSYLKQRDGQIGWSPFLCVYNWSNGKERGWDKFVQKVGNAPVVFDESLIGSSEDNIIDHLEYLGYYGSTVATEVEYRKRKAYVHYDVTLGKRFPISSITYDVPKGEFEEVFMADTANVGIRPGDYLSEAALEAESVRGSQHMRNNGFFGFTKNYYTFEADTLGSPDSASLKLHIRNYTRNESESEARELRRFHIDKVSISHPASLKFREKVLKELNTVHPGDLYDESDISRTYSRLSALRVFNSVNVEMTPTSADKVDCEISMSQSKVQGFKINLEASSNSTGLFGVSPQLSYYNKNIFHGGEWLNLGFMGNFQFKFKDKVSSNEFGVSAGISFPRFVFIPTSNFKNDVPRTDVNFSYNYQSRPEYTRNIFSLSFGYSGNLSDRFFYQAYPLQLGIVRLFDLDPNFYSALAGDPFLRNAYQNHFDFGAGTMLYYTTDTDANPKTSRFYTRLQFDMAGNLLSAFKKFMEKDSEGAGLVWNTPFSQYVRAELTVGKTWRFGRKNGQAIATRLLAGAGYAYGNSTALPFEKHFYAGGANSLRGWQARTVGPGAEARDDSFVIPNQTGDIKMEANVEYRFDMFWKIAGALFVDAGNVWELRGQSPESKFEFGRIPKTLAANWGLGVRCDLNFILIRVDAGFKMYDPSRDEPWVKPAQWLHRNGFAIHFGVGYPF